MPFLLHDYHSYKQSVMEVSEENQNLYHPSYNTMNADNSHQGGMYLPTLSHTSVSQTIVQQQKIRFLEGMNGFYTRSKATGSSMSARIHAARHSNPNPSA